MTTKKKPEKPAYEPPIVSYYTLRAASGEPEPPVIPVINPTVQPAATPKEN